VWCVRSSVSQKLIIFSPGFFKAHSSSSGQHRSPGSQISSEKEKKEKKKRKFLNKNQRKLFKEKIKLNNVIICQSNG